MITREEFARMAHEFGLVVKDVEECTDLSEQERTSELHAINECISAFLRVARESNPSLATAPFYVRRGDF